MHIRPHRKLLFSDQFLSKGTLYVDCVRVSDLTTYRFRPEVVDGGRLGMVEARSWTERVLGWVGSSMRPGASAGCWASGCRGNARHNGRTSRFWLRPC